MLETKKLDDLFRLLDEMTWPGVSEPKVARLLKMQRVQNYCLIGYLLLTVASPWLPAWMQCFSITPSELPDALLIGYCLSLNLILVLVFVTTYIFIAPHRKEFGRYLNPSKKDKLHRDAKFIKQLLTFDKAILTYGLLWYRHRWSSPEGRVGLFVGDLRKLGLFPALAALIISIATWCKEDSNPYLWGPVVIVAASYLMALLILSRERPQQVIQLLEYAIQHTYQCNTTPSDANH